MDNSKQGYPAQSTVVNPLQQPSSHGPPPVTAQSQQGFVNPLQQPSSYGPPPVTTQSQQGSVVVVQQDGMYGNCPVCRRGILVEDYTCLGVCLAIVFFPIGLLCCLAMRERRCTNCDVTY